MTDFADIVGGAHVLTGADMAPYLTDWTGVYTGSAHAVLRPGSPGEVAQIVAAIYAAMVAQRH